ncbi:hypothetical protein H9Q13_17850 [Pontibacter sp. JH31]|uniref:Uncharacterized protein n=1 Tax=Pontibacter aquaedesilientis TaxID=2766980 RepID=A0ABR7XL80_9BACT|nr:hypothetical protein [Pontibacter aquaedesilientis]MBD1399035.1 hypothetical protein [Pontibacter aquaedesilientis]
MEYNIKFVAGGRLIAVGFVGMVLSISIPVYLEVNFGISGGLMGGLILSGTLLSFYLAYLVSKQSEHFIINDQGLTSRKHGEILWNEIHSLNIEDRNELEVFTIKFRFDQEISIPSKIDESQNRKTFVAFKEEVERRMTEEIRPTDELLQYSNHYDRKVHRYVAYVMTIVLILLIPYILYLVVAGEMTLKKLSAILLIYGSSMPLIVNVMQARMKRANKIAANQVQP